MSGGPTLFVLGASHHTTPIELREKLALGPDKLSGFYQRLAAVPDLAEVAVLNTCNRVEFYGVARDTAAIERLQAAFCELQALPPEMFNAIRSHATGEAAIQHLIEVSAGLDSQMLGENEIFGQVKDAYADAQHRGKVGPVLNRVFQKAFQAAKGVRSGTAITIGQISVANVAVDLALTIFGQLGKTRVLLLGAGDIGEKTAKAFLSRGACTLTVSSRTLEHAMALASTLDATALPFEHFSHHLHEFDVVVSSTAAPGTIITREVVAAAIRRRPSQPIFLIDLALPRDVDPQVGGLENVFLYNLDDLAAIAQQNLAARTAEVEHARRLIAERTKSLWAHLVARGIDPTAAPPTA